MSAPVFYGTYTYMKNRFYNEIYTLFTNQTTTFCKDNHFWTNKTLIK